MRLSLWSGTGAPGYQHEKRRAARQQSAHRLGRLDSSGLCVVAAAQESKWENPTSFSPPTASAPQHGPQPDCSARRGRVEAMGGSEFQKSFLTLLTTVAACSAPRRRSACCI